MVQGFINGIKSMISGIGNAASGIANKVKEFLHFSRPDKGPLREYEKWMPDMVEGLSKTLRKSYPILHKASKELAEKVKDGLNLSDLQASVEIEKVKDNTLFNLRQAKMTEKSSIATQAGLLTNRDNTKTTNNDNSTVIHNTQNFYEKNATPYEEQKQAKQQLRRLVYEL